MPRTTVTKPVEPDEDVESTEAPPSKLPLISVLDKGAMQTAKEMLAEAQVLQERIGRDGERLAEIKASLCEIADAFELPGMRYGAFGLEYHGWKTKRTLDKRLLLENGVDAETIKNSYTESKPFLSARFVKVKL
jgi:hypothetical protein